MIGIGQHLGDFEFSGFDQPAMKDLEEKIAFEIDEDRLGVLVAAFGAAAAQRLFGRPNVNVSRQVPARAEALDTGGANTMRRDPVTRLLGLRTWHTREINVPLYAYQTDLTHGGVIAGARNVRRASRNSRLVTVDDGQRASHLDPVAGDPR